MLKIVATAICAFLLGQLSMMEDPPKRPICDPIVTGVSVGTHVEGEDYGPL